MQKMLVGLILFLTLAVGVMAMFVASLSDDVDRLALARPGRTEVIERPSIPVSEPVSAVDSRELQSLRIRVADLQSKHAQLRRMLDQTLSRLSRTADAEGGGDPERYADAVLGEIPGRTKDGAGNWQISDEEVEYAIALKKHVDRKRRLDGQVRSITRRIDNLVTKGEMAPIPEQHAEQFDGALAKYVARNDDLMTRYFRDPLPEVSNIDAKERRELLKNDREVLQQEAAAELGDLLGDEQGSKVAEAMFSRGWRNRRESTNRRNFRRNR